MIYSMTGYGRAQQTAGGQEITVEIRSVNHRFFEFSARIPRFFGYLEERLKACLAESISRGKVDVSVSIVAMEGIQSQVRINEELARSYLGALRGLSEKLGIEDDLALSAMARFPDIFIVHKAPVDEDETWNAVEPVVKDALLHFMDMRSAEGGRLSGDILARLEAIEGNVGAVEELSPQAVAAYRQKLNQKLAETLEGYKLDEARILTEAAIFAEKTAVDEETVRLRSHIDQLRIMLAAGSPAGRKLDFLVQELNREANTIGSKCQDVSIANLVVEIKSDIEKIREQVQNIE